MRIVTRVFAVCVVAAPFAAHAQTLSNEVEIRSVFSGNTVSGEENGAAYHEYFIPDGRIVGESGEGRYKGYWQISKGRMCVSYDEDDGKVGAWDCSHVGLSGSRITWTEDGKKSYSTIAAGNPHGL
jgi:hypothetical protein